MKIRKSFVSNSSSSSFLIHETDKNAIEFFNNREIKLYKISKLLEDIKQLPTFMYPYEFTTLHEILEQNIFTEDSYVTEAIDRNYYYEDLLGLSLYILVDDL